MPSSWPIVMTPVPPTPADDDAPGACSATAGSGSGNGGSAERVGPRLLLGFFSWPPSTVTKLGQKPFAQE